MKQNYAFLPAIAGFGRCGGTDAGALNPEMFEKGCNVNLYREKA